MSTAAVAPIAFPIRRAYALLFTALVATHMGQTMLFAVLAPLGREVGLSELQVGAIISASSLSFFAFSGVWGRVSDRWGRRRVILVGLLGYAVGTALFASGFWAALAGLLPPTAAFATLALTRMAQSSVMSATPPAASAFMADITTVENRARGMGSIAASQNVGAIAGPALGGLLALFSLLTPIWMGAGLTLAAAGLVYLMLPEPPRHAHNAPRSRLSYTDRRIAPFVIVGVVMFVGFAIVQQTLAFRIQDVLQLSGAETARSFGFALMLAAAASLCAQVFVVRRGSLEPMTLLRIALPTILVAFAILGVAENLPTVMAAMALLGFGMGMAGPGFMAGASVAVGAHEQGALAGVTSSCPPLGFTIGPLLGTALYQIDGHLPYLAAVVMYVPLTLFTFALRGRSQSPAPEADLRTSEPQT